LRAKGQSKTEKTLQVSEVKELVTTLSNITERAGFFLFKSLTYAFTRSYNITSF